MLSGELTVPYTIWPKVVGHPSYWLKSGSVPNTFIVRGVFQTQRHVECFNKHLWKYQLFSGAQSIHDSYCRSRTGAPKYFSQLSEVLEQSRNHWEELKLRCKILDLVKWRSRVSEYWGVCCRVQLGNFPQNHLQTSKLHVTFRFAPEQCIENFTEWAFLVCIQATHHHVQCKAWNAMV